MCCVSLEGIAMKQTTGKPKKTYRVSWTWYVRSVIVIISTLLLLTYLILSQFASLVLIPLSEAQSGAPVAGLTAIQNAFFDSVCKSVIIVMAVGVFWSFFTMQNYHIAVNNLLDIFGIAAPETRLKAQAYSRDDRLDFLEASVKGILQTNRYYQTRLEQQQEAVRENFLIRLMRGRLRDIPTVYESAGSLGIDLRASGLQVLLFVIEDSDTASQDDNMDAVYSMLRGTIEAMVREAFVGHLVEIDGMMACLIMPLTSERLDSEWSEQEIARIARLTQQIVRDQTGFSLGVSVSRVNRGISGVEQAFSESLEIYQYAQLIGDTNAAIFYDRMQPIHLFDRGDYFFFEKERQFINCIASEDYRSASIVFNEILESDYIRNATSLKLASCRLFGLVNSMMNAMGEMRLTMDADFFDKLDPSGILLNCNSIPELKQQGKAIFDKINYYTESQKKHSPYDKMLRIVDYLKETYSNPDLSVSLIAEHFDMHPSYLSRTFKKLMGIGLADYLQRLRIKEAKELMKDKKRSVREVSEIVGYNSVLTMNRAFKKYEGTTPGKIRLESN